MKQTSIVFKLFLLTTGLFTVTFLLFFLGQSLFLEKFYIKKKINNVKQAFETFVSEYEKSDQEDMNMLQKLKRKFYDQTNAELILLDQNGVIKSKDYYYVEMQDAESKENLYVPLNNILTEDSYTSFTRLAIQENDSITVRGIPKNNIIIPVSIQTGSREWKNNYVIEDLEAIGADVDDIQDGFSDQQLVVQVEGSVTELRLPSKTDLQLANDISILLQGVQRWWLSVSLNETDPTELTMYSYQENNEVKTQMFVKPVLQNGKITEFAFAMTSLQPVNEAMGVLQHYYVYAFIIVFIVIILLSFYYSKIIANPLIKINEVTKKMAELDFSEKLKSDSEDEIGSLSRSINTLSISLKDRIDELRIANTKLLQDVETERQLEHTRKEFISGVSHELKTPLSVIRSFAEGIKDGVSKNTDHYTDVILEEVDKMNTLIIDMLELAKLESGTYKLDMSPFSINELLQHVHMKLLFSMEEKELHVDVNVLDNMIVLANRNRIEQVVVNLVSNAIQHTPHKGCITIRAAKEGTHVKISVCNSGHPIAEDSLSKIWDRFYRLDASRSRHTGGTGLGLSIVKNILELHKAAYGVQNEENGVCFYFFLEEADE